MADWLSDKFPAFAAALKGYRCSGDSKGKGRCPNDARHKAKDKHMSLIFQLADNGGLTFKCCAGCPKQDVLRAAGLTWKDVCADKPVYATDPEARRKLPMRQIVHVYQYRRPVGEGAGVEFEVVRYFPKDFRPRRAVAPDRYPGEYAYRLMEGHLVRVESRDRVADPTGFKWVEARNVREGEAGSVHLPAVRPTLYNTDLLTSFEPDAKIVLWCEGEKDCDNLSALGHLSTSVQGGSNNRIWCPEWSALVRGRTVVFLPDNDTPGVEYAAWYAGACLVAGAAGVATVRLPGLKKKGDVSDWLFANRSGPNDRGPKSALALKLRGVLAQADLYRPQKLYAAFGLPANPVKGHGNPQHMEMDLEPEPA